jgi:hypothetical protein
MRWTLPQKKKQKAHYCRKIAEFRVPKPRTSMSANTLSSPAIAAIIPVFDEKTAVQSVAQRK